MRLIASDEQVSVYSDCFWTETFFPIEKVEVQNLRKVWKHTRFTCSPGGHRSGK